MSGAGTSHALRRAPSRVVETLRARLAEAEETLRAIRSGEVDAVVVAGEQGARVFTLEGIDEAYRTLIESMNEGAVTLAADGAILYANGCFARMVGSPLQDVIGGSLGRFLSAGSRDTLRPLLKRPDAAGSTAQVLLRAADGSERPAQVSIRPLPGKSSGRATIGLVVTDMSEARRNEDMLRALSRRVVQAQETERERVALELHDNITQLLCAILFRTGMLTAGLPVGDEKAKKEVQKVREMLGTAVEEVQRISHHLRPSALDQLGLVVVLRSTAAEFSARTGVSIRWARARLAARLPAHTELALYRIFQEALTNVEKHANAAHVTVSLRQQGGVVQMVIRDDGIGFEAERLAAGPGRPGGLGLLGMRERATDAGGTLEVGSIFGSGAVIDVRIPVPRDAIVTRRAAARSR